MNNAHRMPGRPAQTKSFVTFVKRQTEQKTRVLFVAVAGFTRQRYALAASSSALARGASWRPRRRRRLSSPPMQAPTRLSTTRGHHSTEDCRPCGCSRTKTTAVRGWLPRARTSKRYARPRSLVTPDARRGHGVRGYRARAQFRWLATPGVWGAAGPCCVCHVLAQAPSRRA